MRLPNAENAVVEIEKLTEYCLSLEHPRGKHKARVFQSVCGITAEHAEDVQRSLLEAVREGEAVATFADGFGQRFVIEWMVTGPIGTAVMVTGWIIRHDEDFPRFVTAYIL